MQHERSQLERLAGTSAGDGPLQVDAFLKEVSMGGHVQPVIGMGHCHDLAGVEHPDDAWTAREGFVVTKAEARVTEDGRCVVLHSAMLETGTEGVRVVFEPHRDAQCKMQGS